MVVVFFVFGELFNVVVVVFVVVVGVVDTFEVVDVGEVSVEVEVVMEGVVWRDLLTI